MSQASSGSCCYSNHQRRLLPFRNTKTGVAITLLWIALSLFLAVLTLIAVLQPTWLFRSNIGSIGLLSTCIRKGSCPMSLAWSLDSISSAYWKGAVVFHLIGCVLFCISPNVVLIAHCFKGSERRNIGFLIAGVVQFIGAVCLMLTCLLFPAGWEAPVVKDLCSPSASSYDRGLCSLGWAYILAILSTIDAVILCVIVFFLYERQLHVRDSAVSQPLFQTTDCNRDIDIQSPSRDSTVLTLSAS